MRRTREGFTLIEFLVSIVILTIISIGMFTAFAIITQMQIEAKNQAIATTLAQGLIENIRSKAEEENPASNLPYFDTLEKLYTDNLSDRKPIPNDPDGLYGGFTYNQRVEAKDDDDLLGFDLKRVVVNLYWMRNDKEEHLTLVTMLSHPAVSLPGNVEGQVYVAGSSPRAYIQSARVYLGGSYQYTNSQGYYSFTNVPSGTYDIKAVRSGYYDKTLPCTIPSDATITVDIPLEPLPAPGAITGTITDSKTGEPIGSTYVRIKREATGYSYSPWANSMGVYLRTGLQPENYIVSIWSDYWAIIRGYINSWKPVTVLVKSNETTIQDIELDPIPTGGISGRVTDTDTGNGIAGATVRVYWRSYYGHILYTTTNSEGYYSEGIETIPIPQFVGRPNHRVYAYASGYYTSSSQYPTLTEDVITPNINFKLKLVPPPPPPPPIPVPVYGKVQGTVTSKDTGLGIEGVSVKIYNKSGATNASGYYAIGDIKVGTHKVYGSKSGYYRYDSYYYDGYRRVKVLEDQTATFNFIMDEVGYGTVTGTVTSLATGKPIEGVSITLRVRKYYGAPGGYYYYATTNANGRYTMEQVLETLPGRTHYYIRARKPGYVAKYLYNFKVPPDTTTTFDFALPIDQGGM